MDYSQPGKSIFCDCSKDENDPLNQIADWYIVNLIILLAIIIESGGILMETEQMAKVIDPERLDFAKEHLVLEENVAYADQHERQIMDLIYPEQHSGKMPVIIWIHGGGWSDEVLDKRYRPELQLGELAKMGFFIASIEYRLCQHAPFPAQIQDCKCADRKSTV